MYEYKRLIHNLTSGNGTEDAELTDHLNSGWEIIDTCITSDVHNHEDGFYRQYVTQVIMLQRALFDHLEDTEEADIPAPMFTDLGRLAILNASRRNGDDLSGYVSMSSVGGAE